VHAACRRLPSHVPSVGTVPGTLSPVVQRPEREADCSLPCSAKVKTDRSYTSTLSIRLLTCRGISLHLRYFALVKLMIRVKSLPMP
jgi:hypothetical protein